MGIWQRKLPQVVGIRTQFPTYLPLLPVFIVVGKKKVDRYITQSATYVVYTYKLFVIHELCIY